MILTIEKIVQKTEEIMVKSGPNKLTLENIAFELEVDETLLLEKFGPVDKYILLVLEDFSKDLLDCFKTIQACNETPETELKLFFQKIYTLLLNKPFYRFILFNKDWVKGNERIQSAIFEIKSSAENFLSTIINDGKKTDIFKNQESTKSLASKILAGFRLFMKDEQLMDEMILELKTLKDYQA